jgi:hypothetical protein
LNPAEDYILKKPQPWQSILLELRFIILSISEEVEESYKWHMPFYNVQKQMFCFLNFRKTYVDLGIPYGIHLKQNTQHLIDGENRKMLRSLRFYTLEDVDHTIVKAVLTDAFQNLKQR